MKRITTILILLFLSFGVKAQTFINNTTQSDTNAIVTFKGGLNSDLMFQIKRDWVDTANTFGNKARSYMGSIIRTGNILWVRGSSNGNTTPNIWYQLATGTIPSTFNAIQGYGLLLTGTYPNITFTVDTTHNNKGITTWNDVTRRIDSVASDSLPPIPFGIWQRKGITVKGQQSTNKAEEATVLYDTANARFHIYYTDGVSPDTPKIYHRQGTDGKNWQDPVLVATGYNRNATFKYGSTYYMYLTVQSPGNSNSSRQYDLFTSSDGVSFSLSHANVLHGGSSGVDSLIENKFVFVESGTWYMLYEAYGAIAGVSKFRTCLATSSDGIIWIKYSGNPVINMARGSSRPFVYKNGGTYYLWMQNGSLPEDVYRYYSYDLITWYTDIAKPVFARVTENEGAFSALGQVADVYMLEHNGSIFFYYTAVQSGSNNPSFIKLAKVPLTFGGLISTQEDANSVYTDNINGYYGIGTTLPTDPTVAITQPKNLVVTGNVNMSSLSVTGKSTILQASTGAAGSDSLFVHEAGTGALKLISPSYYGVSGSGVTSLTGTPNQVSVSTNTGSITVSLPTNVIVGGTFSATTLYGTIGTSAQPNITSVGSLTGLTVAGYQYIKRALSSGNYSFLDIANENDTVAFSFGAVASNVLRSRALNIIAPTNDGDVQLSLFRNANGLLRSEGAYFYVNGYTQNLDFITRHNNTSKQQMRLYNSQGSVTISQNPGSFDSTHTLNVDGTLYVTGNISGAGGITTTTMAATGKISATNANFSSLPTGSSSNNFVTISGGELQSTAVTIPTQYLQTVSNTTLTMVSPFINFSTTGNITGNTIVGTLTTASQTNITTVGTLTALTVTNSVSAANVYAGNIVKYSDTAGMLSNLLRKTDTLTMLSNYPTTAGYGLLKSSKILSVDTTFGYLATNALLKKKIDSLGAVSGTEYWQRTNTTLSPVTSGDAISTTGNITGTNLAGTLTTASQTNITTVGTLGALTVANSITATTVYAGNIVKYSDTASMLANRLKISDTATMLAPYLQQANNGLTKSGQIVTLGGLLNKNTTITDSTFTALFTNTKKINNASKFGLNGEFNLIGVTGNDATQVIYAGLYGSMSWTSADNYVLHPRAMYSAVNGTNYFGNAGSITGTGVASGLSGWLLMSNTGAITNLATSHIKTPMQQVGGTSMSGKVTTYGALTIDNQRDSSDIQSNMQNMYSAYFKGAHDTAYIVGNLKVDGNIGGTLTSAAQTNITSVGTLSALTVSGSTSLQTLYATTINASSNIYGKTSLNLGGSNGDYPSIGYNTTYTASSNTYNYTGGDFASLLQFNAGGFVFKTAPASTGAITFTDRLTVSQTGNVTIANLSTGPVYSSSGILTNTAPAGTSPIKGSVSTTGTATTVVTVTIGQTMLNTNYVPVIGATDLLTAVNYYITNKTTTTFDVNFVSGLTGTIAFGWVIVP